MTRATVLAEISNSVTGGTAAFYNPAFGEVSDIYEGDPEYNDFKQDQWRLGYEVEHDLSDSVTLRQNFRAAKVDIDLQYSGHYPVGTDLARYWGHYIEGIETQVLDNGVRWNVDTGAVAHEILAGVDATRTDYDTYSYLGYVSAAETAAADVPFTSAQKSRQLGVYVHDQMRWGNWQAYASVRWDRVETTSTEVDHSTSQQTDTGQSGRLALSYEWANGVMAYGSVSTSFAPNIGFVYDDPADDGTRRATRPTQSTQREIGVKYAPEATNLLISAALFEIDQRDGVVLDVSTGENRQRQLDLSSRGIELEAQANWDNGFGMIASYAHQRVKIEKGATGTQGKELSGTPNDTLSLWGKYDIQSGPMAGLGLAAGLRYVSQSYGDDANTIVNDARSFVDLSISYDVPQAPGIQMQLNVKNLFDLTKETCTAGYCYRDEGRTRTASLSRRF
ncbi:TonB-dependent receptor domain-containing protein [Paracoccus simplex]|uniref:TonB-dependent receptor domain-containing protein n=1 Tax=Paracoccus simplex TaxID=2086346 RepID=A0ABV7S4G3_9RHOB